MQQESEEKWSEIDEKDEECKVMEEVKIQARCEITHLDERTKEIYFMMTNKWIPDTLENNNAPRDMLNIWIEQGLSNKHTPVCQIEYKLSKKKDNIKTKRKPMHNKLNKHTQHNYVPVGPYWKLWTILPPPQLFRGLTLVFRQVPE